MKSNFAIFIDSTGDLDSELRKQFDVDYVNFWVSVEGGENIPASLDYDQGLTHHDFYQTMRDGKRIFTSQVTEKTLREKWTPLLQEGIDILYIACSSGLSASYDLACKVAAALKDEFKGHSHCFQINGSLGKTLGKALGKTAFLAFMFSVSHS